MDMRASTSPETELVRYDAMISAIASCHKVDEVKELRDKARALELYAKQARNLEAEIQCANVRVRAEKRAGVLLKEMAASGERATVGGDGRNQHGGSSQPASTLADLKITATQSSRWMQLAEVPEDVFEQALRDPVTKPTTAGLLKLRQEQPKRLNDQSLWLWGRLRDLQNDGYLDADARFLLDEMTDAMRADCARIIPLASAFLTELQRVLDER